MCKCQSYTCSVSIARMGVLQTPILPWRPSGLPYFSQFAFVTSSVNLYPFTKDEG